MIEPVISQSADVQHVDTSNLQLERRFLKWEVGKTSV